MKSLSLRGILGVMTIAALLVSCEQSRNIYDDKLSVLGTFADITITGLPKSEAAEAAQIVGQDLKKLDHVGYTFKPEGELHELNSAIAQGDSLRVSDELLSLIKQAKTLYKASNGLLNPATGELIALWEFHCSKADCAQSPYPDEVRRLVEEKSAEITATRPSMDDIIIDGNSVRSNNPTVRLEFGDLIRGHALDKGIEHLQNLGIKNVMIDIGGSIRSLGNRVNRPWWAAVLDASGEHSVGYIETNEGEAVVTVRAFDRSAGKLDYVYRHVVDPRTGLPVKQTLSVTVIHENAVWANAAATALLIADKKDWQSVMDSLNVRAAILFSADGGVSVTEPMEKRIQWNARHRHEILSL